MHRNISFIINKIKKSKLKKKNSKTLENCKHCIIEYKGHNNYQEQWTHTQGKPYTMFYHYIFILQTISSYLPMSNIGKIKIQWVGPLGNNHMITMSTVPKTVNHHHHSGQNG